ncbi:MAG: hypothetical protein GY952_08340 [Rhodobacteraceae bacterium]|nr:hypothetical protein [Paracoccaceae bacterium]
MRLLIACLVLIVGANNVVAEPRGGYVSLSEAEQKCSERAYRFSRSTFGRYAEHPEPYLVWTRYRACVYANSRQYPSSRPDFTNRKLFRLNKVLE